MTTRTIIAEPRPHHDRDGALLGVFVGDAYYPIADLLRAADDLAVVGECYADRDRDLAFEYTARMAAEAQADAWRAVATIHADHEDYCDHNAGDCICGYSRAYSAAIQADYTAAAPRTPYAREVAVGRATLAAARAEAAYMAEVAAHDGCEDLARLATLRGAWADAGRARRAAVETALAEEASCNQ